MKILAAVLLMLSLAGSAPPLPPPIDYRFDQVKRTVKVGLANQLVQTATGATAKSGDLVETGWFSYALIASEQHRARFEVFSSSSVELAGGAPGILLSVNRGRVHAMFDKLVGNEPRVVKTPGALLAVRGTQYSVEVSSAGLTTLDVFEGTVEVQSPLRAEPFLIHARETASFSRREPPVARPMPQGTTPDRGHPGNHDGMDPANRGGHGFPDGDHSSQPPGGHAPGGQPAPPPMPMPHGHR